MVEAPHPPALEQRPLRALEVTAVFIGYSLVALWWLWPLPLHLDTHVAYFLGETPVVVADALLNMWILSWDAHALVTAPLRLFETNAFYPSPMPLAYSEHLLGYLPFFAPTYWITGNPVLSTNLVILSTYPLAGLGAYALARRFVPPPGALLAGFLYAFSPIRLESVGHVQGLGIAYLPLAIFFSERWLEAGRRRDALGIAVCFALQLLCSFYLAYAAALAYAVYLPLALLRWRTSLDAKRLVGLVVALGTASAPFLVASLPYVLLRRGGYLPEYGSAWDVLPLGTIAPVAAKSAGDYLQHQGVGVVGYALGALALLPPWRRRAWPLLLSVALIATSVVVAQGSTIHLGPIRLPGIYDALRTWIPGFATLRVLWRFLVIAQVGFVLLAGLGLARLASWLRPGLAWPASVAACALALASFLPLPEVPLHPQPVGAEVPPAYRWLAQHGEGRLLLELPGARYARAAEHMYLSTYHWLPIVDGYGSYASGSIEYIFALTEGLPGADALARLTGAVDVGWILVHRGEMRDRGARWNETLPDGLERVAEFGDDLLIRVTVPPIEGVRERLFDTTKTLQGAPLAPLGADCPGAVQLLHPPVDVWKANARVPILLELENSGTTTWPGFGLVPRYLVRVAACLGGRDSPPCKGVPQPLPQDIPAGDRLRLTLRVKVPPYPGEYNLRVDLIQVGVGSLEACGFTPLVVPITVDLEPPATPRGSYWESCRRCRYEGETFRCLCLDGKGGEREISTNEVCEKGYANQFGKLVCEGSAPSGAEESGGLDAG